MSMKRVERTAESKRIWQKATAKRETHEIPVSQFGRVRTLTSYGMTRARVAEFYGVNVDEIDRIIKARRYLPKVWSIGTGTTRVDLGTSMSFRIQQMDYAARIHSEGIGCAR